MPVGHRACTTPRLNRALGLRELVLYGIVLIQPTAPMPLYGVVCAAGQGARRHDDPDRHGGHAVHGDQLRPDGQRPIPSAGSAYTYVGRELHPALGYLTGWAMIFDYVLNPIICVIWCSKAAMNFVPRGAVSRSGPCSFAALFTLLNLRGIKASARTNEWITAGLGVVIVLFFVAAARTIWRMPDPDAGRFLRPFYDPETFSWKAVSTGTSIAMLTYIGFDGISTLSEEAHNPRRNILLATVLTCLITGVLAASAGLRRPARLAQLRGLSRRRHRVRLHRRPGRRAGPVLHRQPGAARRHDRLRGRLAPRRGPAALRHGPRQRHPQPLLRRAGSAHAHPAQQHPPRRRAGPGRRLHPELPARRRAAELRRVHRLHGREPRGLRALLRARASKRTFLNLVPPLLGFVICLYIWWSLRTPAKLAGLAWLAAGLLYGAWKTRGFRHQVEFAEPDDELA